jgi:hypothetical protein
MTVNEDVIHISSAATAVNQNEIEKNKKNNDKTWKQFKTIVDFSRKMQYVLVNDIPSNISFRKMLNDKNKERIYFLASSHKNEATIKQVTIDSTQPIITNSTTPVISGINIFINSDNNQKEGLSQPPPPASPASPPKSTTNGKKQKLTKEEQLLRERKRCSLNGITAYYLDAKTDRILFSESSELFGFDDNTLTNNYLINEPFDIQTNGKGAIDFKTCPSNSNLVSYILDNNLWLYHLRTNQRQQLTNTKGPMASGVPSFICQEEFNRYNGYWWQPVYEYNSKEKSMIYRIVYEECDDSLIDETFITPSCVDEFGYDSYRYPKAGSANSIVKLKMIEITLYETQITTDIPKDFTFRELVMSQSFYELFNWYEYLVRGDWTLDGKHFWCQIYDRLQQRFAMILLPVDFFVSKNEKVKFLNFF